MRQFVKFPPNYWLSSEMHNIKQLGGKAGLLAVYLLTAPGSLMSGIYHCPCAIMSTDLGLPEAEVKELLQDLVDIKFCYYDDAHEYIWVCDLVAMQVGDRFFGVDKRLRIIHYQLSQLPELSFFDKFVERHRAQYFLDELFSGKRETKKVIHQPLIRSSSNKLMNKRRRTYKGDGSSFSDGKKYCSYLINGERCPNVAVATRGVHHGARWYCQEHARNN